MVDSKFINKKIIVILALIVLVVVLGGIYLKPTNTDKIPSAPETVAGLATKQQKDVGMYWATLFKDSLVCHYGKNKQYPRTLGSIIPECLPKIDEKTARTPAMSKTNTGEIFNYMPSEEYQKFSFEIPVIEGEGYYVTDKSIEYIVIPEQTKQKMKETYEKQKPNL